MQKDNLFELIRKEEVIIWAGAGLSIYAGYPSGTKLCEILIDNLSKSEKEIINKNLFLPDLAEEYYRLKGNNKNSLISVLKKTFIDFKPNSNSCHDNLAIIPHFKTIITTNYDKLFENSYGPKAQIVFSSLHVPYIEKEKTQIFKVHGDLSEPDSIIITKSDYFNFFKTGSENDVYWTVIKERLATKSILFLGYNLEDPNISVIFDRISDTLGSHRRESFLVAPGLLNHKANNLIRKGIHYIDCTAEELITDLIFNLKEHIIQDFEIGNTSADTFRAFLLNMGLLPDLKGNENNFNLKAIRGVKDKIDGKMDFVFKDDAKFIKEFEDYISGNKIKDFEITNDNIIKAEVWVGGIKLPNYENIERIIYKSNPKISALIDIRFENGFEASDIPIKLYASSSVIEVHVEFKNAQLILKIDRTTLPETKVEFNFKHNDICNKVKEEIELYTLLSYLANGTAFIIYTKSGDTFSQKIPIINSLFEDTQYFLNYFNNLKIIEQNYNIRFSNFELDATITEELFNKVQLIISAINNKNIEYHWDKELELKLEDNVVLTIEQLKELNESPLPVIANYKIEEVISLHGHNINIGFKKVEFLEPYVSNLQSLINNEERIVKIRSRIKKIVVSYTKNIEN